MRRIATFLIPLLGVTWVSLHLGCQDPTLVTQLIGSSPAPVAVEGMLYYLPIGKITIKGQYTPATGGGKEDKQQSTIGAEKTDPVLAAPPAKPARSHGEPTGGGGDSSSVSGGPLTLTVTSIVEADEADGVYYVTPQINDIFEDEVQVTINAKHLLSAGKVTTEDKTAEIVGTIASLAATAAGRFAQIEKPPQPFSFSFDPFSHDQVKFVHDQLKNRQIGLTVKVDGQNVTDNPITVLPKEKVQQVAADLGRSGLVFRLAAVCSIRLVYPLVSGEELKEDDPRWMIRDTEQFILPDRSTLSVMKYNRMAFVKKVREVGFSDGMLTDFHQKRPSPILGFLGIPKAIVQAVVPIPGAASSGSASSSGTTGAH